MKILAAYKPSPLGDAVLAATIREARLRDAEVFIARHVRHDASRVSGPLALMDPGSGQEVAPGGASDDVAKLREDLEGLAWQVRSGGVACDAVLIADRENDAEAILELALNAHVGLIVVGIRRRHRWARPCCEARRSASCSRPSARCSPSRRTDRASRWRNSFPGGLRPARRPATARTSRDPLHQEGLRPC